MNEEIGKRVSDENYLEMILKWYLMYVLVDVIFLMDFKLEYYKYVVYKLCKE